jgi:vacuolar protein sorting-associated protein 41
VDTVDVIVKYNLFDNIRDDIFRICQIDIKRAVKMLIASTDKLPVPSPLHVLLTKEVSHVVHQLAPRRDLVHAYLHALFQKDPLLGQDFHEAQVDPPPLAAMKYFL